MGGLTFLKHVDSSLSSVPPVLSGKAFLNPGYTGVANIIDPINDISIFMGSNRLQNTIHRIDENMIVKDNGTFKYKDKFVTSKYYLESTKLNNLAAEFAIQCRFLDHINEYISTKSKEKVIIR